MNMLIGWDFKPEQNIYLVQKNQIHRFRELGLYVKKILKKSMKGKVGSSGELLGKNKWFKRKEVIVPWEFSTGEKETLQL